ncbi:hypothetical protein BVRB_4g075590 [Beta vulgaris subsp. vulgaris]|nr:hypothetical protein BVRB_4g075590 [Beta vulgaris subsp. vulgaris]
MVKGFYRIGDNAGVLNLLRKMQCSYDTPDHVMYSTIIDSLCKDRMLKEAMDLLSLRKASALNPMLLLIPSWF